MKKNGHLFEEVDFSPIYLGRGGDRYFSLPFKKKWRCKYCGSLLLKEEENDLSSFYWANNNWYCDFSNPNLCPRLRNFE